MTSGQIGLRQIVHQFESFVVEDYMDQKDGWKRRLVIEKHPKVANLSLLCCVEACVSLKNSSEYICF